MTEPIAIEGDVVDTDDNVIAEAKKAFTATGLAKIVARSSVKFVVAGIVTSLVPEPENKIQKVKVAVGTYVIAGAVAKSTGSFVEEKIEDWKDSIQAVRVMVKQLEEAKTPTP